MIDIKHLLYGRDYIYLFSLDTALKVFENSDFMSNDVLYNHSLPPDFENVFSQLEKDGMIEIRKHGSHITLKGKRKIKKGGYKASALKNRLTFFLILAGTIASIVGLVV